MTTKILYEFVQCSHIIHLADNHVTSKLINANPVT
jgi:hypothetical protein